MKEMTILEQKVRIIAFLELIFSLGKDERSISFAKVAETCQVENSDVQLMLMKAMSFGLIKGTIDEVEGVVHVEWSQPRYLSKSHLEIMHRKMVEWENKMDQVIRLVENNSTELARS